MKIKHPSSEKDPPDKQPTGEKSFSVALEQVAQLLRTEVKLKDRKTKVLSSSSLSTSLQNLVGQVAKLIRTEIHDAESSKKRSWTSTSKAGSKKKRK